MSTKKTPSTSEAVQLARKIVNVPSGEVPNMIRQMLRNRELSIAVGALDDLLAARPEHKLIASRALSKMGLWHCG
jgi:hypothetical protein